MDLPAAGSSSSEAFDNLTRQIVFLQDAAEQLRGALAREFGHSIIGNTDSIQTTNTLKTFADEEYSDMQHETSIDSRVSPRRQHTHKMTILLHEQWQTVSDLESSFDVTPFPSHQISDTARLDREQRGQACARTPSSKLRFAWELISMILIAWDSITIPMLVFDLPQNFVSTLLAWLAPSYWSLDMVWLFFLGFYLPDGTVELSLLRTAGRYLRSWFAFDFSVVAIDWLVVATGGSGKDDHALSRVANTARALRFLRLLRLVKLTHAIHLIQQRIQSNVALICFKTGKAIVHIMMLCHLIACGWYTVGKLYRRSRYNWIDMDTTGDNVPIRTRSPQYRYTTSLHWALVQFGVSGIEIYPTNTAERFYSVVTAVLSLMAFSYIVSSVTSGMSHVQALHRQSTEQNEALRAYMLKHSVSTPVRSKVWNYLRQSSKNSRTDLREDQICLMRKLPKKLYHALRMDVYSPTLSVHPLFKTLLSCYASAINTGGLVQGILGLAVHETCLGPGDELFDFDEMAVKMHFISRGGICYTCSRLRRSLIPDLDSVDLKSDAWLCEQALWMHWTHMGHAEANVSAAELVSLDAATFRQVMLKQASFESRRYAALFVQYAADHRGEFNDVFVNEIALQQISDSIFKPLDDNEVYAQTTRDSVASCRDTKLSFWSL